MELIIAVTSDDIDELLSLEEELVDVDELRGAVRRQAAPLGEGELGAVEEVLIVALGQGGAAAVAGALVTAVVAWIRTRPASVVVKMTGADGTTLEVDARNMRGLSPEQVMQLSSDLATRLDPGRAPGR
ncbi:effector-associated constant component EACC1 [Nocardia gipuzkoensis]